MYLQITHSDSFVPLLNLFTIIEYSFFCYFIYLILPLGFLKKSIPFIWLAFIMFAGFDYVFISTTPQFDSIAIGIESIIVISLCVSYFFSQIRESTNMEFYSTFNFWAVIAFFIYFSGTFFLYIMTEKMMHNLKFQSMYFLINISFNIVKNIMLCIATTMKVNSDAKESKRSLPDLGDDLLFYPQNN